MLAASFHDLSVESFLAIEKIRWVREKSEQEPGKASCIYDAFLAPELLYF